MLLLKVLRLHSKLLYIIISVNFNVHELKSFISPVKTLGLLGLNMESRFGALVWRGALPGTFCCPNLLMASLPLVACVGVEFCMTRLGSFSRLLPEIPPRVVAPLNFCVS